MKLPWHHYCQLCGVRIRGDQTTCREHASKILTRAEVAAIWAETQGNVAMWAGRKADSPQAEQEVS
jgi:hypothetical protein